jgi:hypothetical protein
MSEKPTSENKLKDQTDDQLAERRAELRTETSLLKRKGEQIAAERDDIDAEFKRRFQERNITGTRCQLYTISLRKVDNYPQIVDRNMLEEFILASGKLYLLQNRVAQKHIQEELAVMKDEVEAFKQRLDEIKTESLRLELEEKSDEEKAQNNENLEIVALDILSWIDDLGCPTDINILKSRLDRLKIMYKPTSVLINVLSEMLDASLTIPGIQMVTKETINQIKRS